MDWNGVCQRLAIAPYEQGYGVMDVGGASNAWDVVLWLNRDAAAILQ